LIGAASSAAPSTVKVVAMKTPTTTKNMYMVMRLAGIGWPSRTSNTNLRPP